MDLAGARWDLTPSQAVALQRELAAEIVPTSPGPRRRALVAGVDDSVKNDRSHAAIVVATYPDFRSGRDRDGPDADAVSLCAACCFREVPGAGGGVRAAQPAGRVSCSTAWASRIARIGSPAIRACGSSGPTIGVGKTRPLRPQRAFAEEKGAQPDRQGWETIGAVVRTRTGKHPLFISPGHLPISPPASPWCSPARRNSACGADPLAHKAAGAFA